MNITTKLFMAFLAFSAFTRKAFADSDGGRVIFTNPLAGNSFIDIVNKVTNAIIIIATPIVALMVVIGGFQIILSQGNEEKVSAGKKTITSAAIGFAIILLAKSVVTIIKSILK